MSIDYSKSPIQYLWLSSSSATNAQRLLRGRVFNIVFLTAGVELHPYVDTILQSSEISDIPIDSLHLSHQLTNHELWQEFDSKLYRLHRYTEAIRRQLPIPSQYLKSFWSASMHLSARQVWYRVLCKKIPHGTVVHQMKIVDSPKCCLCHHSLQTLCTKLPHKVTYLVSNPPILLS